VIRAGWSAGGLCPYNPDLVLLLSQVLVQPSIPLPIYPISDTTDLSIQTPQSYQALYKTQQLLQQSEVLSRRTRAVLGKAGKAILQANARAAQLETDNRRLQHPLSQVKNIQSRKRAGINQNERFVQAEAIQAAIDQAAAVAAQNAEKEAKKAALLSIASACSE
jgi:hypothetical protein